MRNNESRCPSELESKSISRDCTITVWEEAEEDKLVSQWSQGESLAHQVICLKNTRQRANWMKGGGGGEGTHARKRLTPMWVTARCVKVSGEQIQWTTGWVCVCVCGGKLGSPRTRTCTVLPPHLQGALLTGGRLLCLALCRIVLLH